MQSTPVPEVATEDGQAALEGLMTGVAIAAWTVFAILLFTALAIAATLYAANKRRELEYAPTTPADWRRSAASRSPVDSAVPTTSAAIDALPSCYPDGGTVGDTSGVEEVGRG